MTDGIVVLGQECDNGWTLTRIRALINEEKGSRTELQKLATGVTVFLENQPCSQILTFYLNTYLTKPKRR